MARSSFFFQENSSFPRFRSKTKLNKCCNTRQAGSQSKGCQGCSSLHRVGRKRHLALQGWGRQGCWQSPGLKQAALPAAGWRGGTASACGPGAAPCWKERAYSRSKKNWWDGKTNQPLSKIPHGAGTDSSVRGDLTPAFAGELGRIKGFCKPQAAITQTAPSPPSPRAPGPAPQSCSKSPVPLGSRFLPQHLPGATSSSAWRDGGSQP